jgi:hypothetical protein
MLAILCKGRTVRGNPHIRMRYISPAITSIVHRKRTLFPGLLKYVLDSLTVAGAVKIPMAQNWNAP